MPRPYDPGIEQETVGLIDRIEFVRVRLPFVTPFGTSVHTWTHKEALLLALGSGGVTAWGECVADPDPYYASETIASAEAIIRGFLLPLLVPGATLGEVLGGFTHVRGNEMARATVENALLLLIALRRGQPLHDALGWPGRRIMSGISIGLREDREELLAAVRDAVARGYQRVKVKIKRGKDIDWVRAVREEFPGLLLMADANGDYSLADLDHLRQLDQFGLMMIEQPLSYSDIYEHSLLQKELSTPICLDESIHGCADARAAIGLGACRVLNIKQGMVGGILEALRMARLAAQNGIAVWSGGMDETGIGRAVNIHLQASSDFTLPGDTSETRNYFAEDVVTPPVVLGSDGFIEIPDGPGLGAVPREDLITKYTVGRERIR